MTEQPQTPAREYDPALQITITMTWEQWGTVLQWLAHAIDTLGTTVYWWKHCCADKQHGADTAARYETGLVKAEEIRAIIETTINQG